MGAKENERELAREWRKNGKNNQKIAQLYLEKVTDGFGNGATVTGCEVDTNRQDHNIRKTFRVAATLTERLNMPGKERLQTVLVY